MSHFAKIDNNNIVTNVLVSDQDFINSGVVGDSSLWVQTSYNTHGGVHSNGEIPLRKNYAGIGHTYDKTRDAFYAPQPYPSWTLNEDTCQWECPEPYPNDGIYNWNEDTLSWVEIPKPYPSWILNETTYCWEAPTPYPDDGEMYTWNEETLTWENS